MGEYAEQLREIVDDVAKVETENDELTRSNDRIRDDIDALNNDLEDRNRMLARELEPIFGAIFAGDLDRARGGVRALHGLLRGDDPIIVAIQRARSNPRLHAHVSA